MEATYTYLLLAYCTCITGCVTINSPGINAEVAPVCSGDELELICTVSGRVLEWVITLMPLSEDTTYEYPLNSVEQSLPVHTIKINKNISLIFSRSSSPNSRPLISRLLISPATSVVNGAIVVCEDTEMRTNSSTRVNVIHKNNTFMDNAELAIHVVNFTSLPELRGTASINLSVSLQLNGTNPSFPYRINIDSEERNVSAKSVGPILFELMVRYDTLYNMSIMVCGELSSVPLIGLYNYSKCGTGPVIIDYDDYLQGIFDNILTDCPHVTSQAPTGPGTADDATEKFGLTSATLGVILGTLSSALAFGTALILCTIIGGVLLVKRKGISNSDSRRQQNECQETTTDYSSLHHDQLDTKNAKESLVYVEVGQVSHRNIPPSLDDTPIEYAQINHKLHTDKNNRVLPLKPVDKSLCVNLDTLLIQLRQQVTAKWYQFGVRAGIHRDVLDNFAKQCSPNDCIIEMLDYWLRNSKQPPTWKDVARILKEINLEQLGHDIDEVYKTGELPVKINMNWIPPIHPAAVESEPPPPPTNREQKYSESTIQIDSETLVPALPPKPNNNWSMTNVPARPPKPTPKSS